MRLLTSLILLVVVAAAGVYAALPWLVSTVVAPRLAETLGAAELAIDLGYPGPRGVTVHAARLTREGLEIDVTDAALEYDLVALRALRATEVRIASLAVTFSPTGAPAAGPSEPQARGFAAQAYLPLVPADRVRIDALEVALPESDFRARGQARLEAGVLAMHLAGIAPEFARDLEADVTLDVTGKLALRVEDPDDAAPSSLRVDGRLAEDDLPIEVAVSLDGSLFRLVQETLALPVGAGRLRGAMQTTLPGIPTGAPDWRSLEGSGELALEWAQPELGIDIRETSATFLIDSGMIDARLSSTAAIQAGGLGLRAVVRDGQFRFDGSAIDSAAPAATVTMASETVTGELEIRSLRVTVDEPAVALAGALEALPGANEVRGDVAATIGLGAPLAGEVAFEGQVGTYPVELSGTVGRDGSMLTADATVRSGPLVDLPLVVRHDLDAASGTVSVTGRLSIRQPLLAATVPGWIEPFDLDRGMLEIDGSYAWGDAQKGTLRLGLTGVRAFYEDIVASGVSGELRIELAEADWQLAPSDLVVNLVDVGFPVTDVELTLSGDRSLVHVEGMTAGLLGGSASAGPFDYDVASGNARLLIELNDVDLQALLALEGDDITGTGRLDGELPVVITANTPSIAAGRVRATGPGRINLASSLASALTQPIFDIALKALENFSYDLLESDVEYRDNGDLLLGLRIHGRNPDIEQGRPIHYNLNISENVPVLLRSLRLTDAVSERIEKKVIR